MLVTFYGGKPDHVAALNITLFGWYWWIFWFVQIGIGVVAPIFIIANSRMRESIGWLGTAGLMVVIGVIGVRFNIVIPPQTTPQFSAIPEAFHHMRYSIGYFPSLNEWLVGIGVLAIGILLFIAALRLTLSLMPTESVTEGDL